MRNGGIRIVLDTELSEEAATVRHFLVPKLYKIHVVKESYIYIYIKKDAILCDSNSTFTRSCVIFCTSTARLIPNEWFTNSKKNLSISEKELINPSDFKTIQITNNDFKYFVTIKLLFVTCKSAFYSCFKDRRKLQRENPLTKNTRTKT